MTISAISGLLGTYRTSIFKLDPTGTVPIEPLADIVPAFTPMRVVIDWVGGEQFTASYAVHEHPIDAIGGAISSGTHKQLEQLTVSGKLINALPHLSLPVPPPPAPAGRPPQAALSGAPLGIPAAEAPLFNLASGIRLDVMRFNYIKAMADAKQPVMVISPITSVAKAFIEVVSKSWSPPDGQSLMVNLAFKEARFASSLLGVPIPDTAAMAGGNNAASGGGQNATSTVNASTTPSGIDAVPPDVITGAG